MPRTTLAVQKEIHHKNDTAFFFPVNSSEFTVFLMLLINIINDLKICMAQNKCH